MDENDDKGRKRVRARRLNLNRTEQKTPIIFGGNPSENTDPHNLDDGSYYDSDGMWPRRVEKASRSDCRD